MGASSASDFIHDDPEHAAYQLFTEIGERHGWEEARRIFMKFGAAPSKRRLAHIENMGLLDRYDMMMPEPNVQRLARDLAKENETLPPEKRHGSSGSTSPMTLDKHIRRLLDERDNRRGWCDFPKGRGIWWRTRQKLNLSGG